MNQPRPDPAEPSQSGAGDQRQPASSHAPEPVDLARESVAGEEDPGAAIELTVQAARKRQDAAQPTEPGKDTPASGNDTPAGAERSKDAPKPAKA